MGTGANDLLTALYSKKRKGIYTCLAIIAGIILIFALLISEKKAAREEGQYKDREKCGRLTILENGRYLPACEVYRRMKLLVLSSPDYRDFGAGSIGDHYSVGIDGDGGLGFYKKGEIRYTFTFACLDSNGEYIEYDSKARPAQVIFYDYSWAAPRIENLAIFAQAFYKDMDYKKTVRYLREEEGVREIRVGSRIGPFEVEADGRRIGYFVSEN